MSRAPLAVLAGLLLAAAAAAQAPYLFLGKNRAAWSKDLADKDASVRRSAAFALGKLGANADADLNRLLALTRADPDAGARAAAAVAVGEIAADLKDGARTYASAALPVLRQALKEDADARVRRGAVYALGAFGPAMAPAVEDVRAALKDRSAGVRQNAAWALGRLGKDAPRDVVDDLATALQDKAALVRRDAATALGEIGLPGARGGVGPLIELVEGEYRLWQEKAPQADQVVLRTALEKLVNLVEEKDRGRSGAIVPLLRDEDPDTSRLAALVLANMGGPDALLAISVLRRVLNEDEPRNQETAAAVLARFGKDAAPAVRDLAAALSDRKRSPGTRRNAALALAAMQKEAEPAVPALLEVLRDRDPRNAELRTYAAEALMWVPYPGNRAAMDEMVKVLKDTRDDLNVRLRCVWATRSVRPLTQHGAQDALVEVLDEPGEQNKIIPYEAARSLALVLGEGAPPKALGPLLRMLEDPNLFVYKGTSARATDVGGESRGPGSETQVQRGGKGNYMAAEALGAMRGTAKTPQIVAALKRATMDEDKRLREAAAQALKDIGAD
jgi:HEAT repeat protein